MWIRTQSGQGLVNVNVVIADDKPNKKGLFSVWTFISAGGFNPIETATLGEYETAEQARVILNEIHRNIVAGSKTYYMLSVDEIKTWMENKDKILGGIIKW
jgi:hypothetical protein